MCKSRSCDLPASVCMSNSYSPENGILFLFKVASFLFQFTMQVLEKQMNYRTQLQHLHTSQVYLQSSTNFEVQYNDHVPFVAGLQWKDASRNGLKKWEGEVPQTVSSLWFKKQALEAAARFFWAVLRECNTMIKMCVGRERSWRLSSPASSSSQNCF